MQRQIARADSHFTAKELLAPTDVGEADTQASNCVCQFVDFMNKLMAGAQSYRIEIAHRMGVKAERISLHFS